MMKTLKLIWLILTGKRARIEQLEGDVSWMLQQIDFVYGKSDKAPSSAGENLRRRLKFRNWARKLKRSGIEYDRAVMIVLTLSKSPQDWRSIPQTTKTRKSARGRLGRRSRSS